MRKPARSASDGAARPVACAPGWSWRLMMNPTTDPALRSFVSVAADSPFPIQNLPFGVLQADGERPTRIGVAIGDMVLDVWAAVLHGLFVGHVKNAVMDALSQEQLN